MPFPPSFLHSLPPSLPPSCLLYLSISPLPSFFRTRQCILIKATIRTINSTKLCGFQASSRSDFQEDALLPSVPLRLSLHLAKSLTSPCLSRRPLLGEVGSYSCACSPLTGQPVSVQTGGAKAQITTTEAEKKCSGCQAAFVGQKCRHERVFKH